MALETWVMVGDWSFLDRYEPDAFLDHLAEAGCRDVAFGGALPIEPNLAFYDPGAVRPQRPTDATMVYSTRIARLFHRMAERGVGIYVYGTNPHMTDGAEAYPRLAQKYALVTDGDARPVESYWGACANGSAFLPYYLGRLRDAAAQFTEMTGFLNDGPEFGYEVAPDFKGGNWSLFACFGPCCATRAAALGYDWGDLQEAACSLRTALRHLNPGIVDAAMHAGDDVASRLAAIAGTASVADWCSFKTDAITAYVARLSAEVKAIRPTLRLGVGSRTAAFAPMTGYDLARIAGYADFVLPKFYVWIGGYDGLYGTIDRWLRTLHDWNPDLAEASIAQLVFALFGITLPDVQTSADLARFVAPEDRDSGRVTHAGAAFPDAFFPQVIGAETRTLIERVGDAARLRPWVGLSHGGRALTPRELSLLLAGAEAAGLRTYLYYGPLEGEAWDVAKEFGNRASHRA